jgi:hypothetical protein
MLYRASGNILHHLKAPVLMLIRPQGFRDLRPSQITPRTGPKPQYRVPPLVPMAHWTSPGAASALRPRPGGRRPWPPDCNPHAVWNCRCLGPWQEFSWPRLLAACRK